MSAEKRISRAFEEGREILFNDYSKIVIMSDCHRGYGGWADDFSKNQNMFFAALSRYEKEKYTYIELGDGDELWENRKMSAIITEYSGIFWLMSRFFNDGRLFFVIGNHDMEKTHRKSLSDSYFDDRTGQYIPVFPGLEVFEGLILKHAASKCRVFLLHGHQADFFNSSLWLLSRFLVRYLWKPLEFLGVQDPTRAAKNNRVKRRVERVMTQWADSERKIVIAGHTHRPVFPRPGQSLYFNDGSCVHPRCITAIEITGGNITLVKWSYKTKEDGTVYVGRDVLAGPTRIEEYYSRFSSLSSVK